MPLSAILLVFLQVGPADAPSAGLPPGPVWGRDTLPPEDANAVFATADGCANCHGADQNSRALVDARGNDVSPHGTWAGTLMAHSFRDPYFRAQLEREVERAPEREAEIVGLCSRCHAPMAFHTAQLSGEPISSIAELDDLPMAEDGVSCTVCHQITARGLGEETTFSGLVDIRPGRVLFGPYDTLATQPMQSNTAYRAAQSSHISSSALCGSCHVLETHGFLEQATYLEWRNSQYSDEGADVAPDVAASCGDCHAGRVDAVPLVRPTQGHPFEVEIRPEVHSHGIVGGNAFMLDLMADRAEDLGLEDSVGALRRAADATRVQLAHRTAELTIENFSDHDRSVRFDVTVLNKAGHKFPSGYPSRRAWIEVEVSLGRQLLFHSGAPEPGFGGIIGVEDAFGAPHKNLISRTRHAQIYEMVGLDAAGNRTTILSEMASVAKDNRLLPLGWRADGPHADRTRPVGTEGDENFVAGSDTVTYSIRRPAIGRVTVRAGLWYQSISPAWADGLAESSGPAADRFFAWYYGDDPAPELVASAIARDPRTD